MSQHINAMTTQCQCRHEADCCSHCYANKRQQLQNQLWDLTVKQQEVQRQMVELEANHQDFKKTYLIIKLRTASHGVPTGQYD